MNLFEDLRARVAAQRNAALDAIKYLEKYLERPDDKKHEPDRKANGPCECRKPESDAGSGD